MNEQEAIVIIENEKTCVRRKIATNCSNCDSCDLVMKDTDILSALDMALSAIHTQKSQKEYKSKGCSGCAHEGYAACACEGCTRTGCYSDNYEQQGEQP